MASKGGRVRVYFEASGQDLERESERAERALRGVGRAGVQGGTQASAGMDRATRSARVLALAGRGAAATTTRIGDAARTATPYLVGGLALGLGKSVIEAREAAKVGAQTEAVIRSTGGAANVTAKEVANLAQKTSQKTGIDDEAIQSTSNLLLTFKNLRNEVGEGNNIFNQATRITTDMSVAMDQSARSSAIQLGKALNDPIAGLGSLSRVGVQFTEQQQEQIAAMVESGDQMQAQKMILRELKSEFGGSARAQADDFDRLQVAAENFAESVGTKATPVLGEMAGELTDIFELKDKDAQVGAIGDFIDKWGTKGIDALGDLAPEVAEVSARLAARAGEAFVEAWWESDALGKLFLTGAFIRAVGGPGVFGKLGAALWTRIVAGMGGSGAALPTVAPTTVPGGGPAPAPTKGPSALNVASKAMPYIPLLGAAAYAGTKFAQANEGAVTAPFALSSAEEYFAERIDQSYEYRRTWIKNLKEVSQADRDTMRERIKAARAAGEISKDAARDMLQGIRLVDQAADRQRRDFARSKGFGFAEAMAKDRKLSGREVDGILRDLAKLPPGARKEAAESMIGMARVLEQKGKLPEGSTQRLRKTVEGEYGRIRKSAIRESARLGREVPRNFDEATNASGQAIAQLGENTNKALSALGVKKLDFGIQTTGKATGDAGKAVSDFARAQGGVIPGYSPVDNFLVAARGGERFLTPEVQFPIADFAMQATYGAGLDDMLRATGGLGYAAGGIVPHPKAARIARYGFAKGGVAGGLDFALGPHAVPPIEYAADHAGGNSHWHITGTTTPWVVALGKKLQSMGFMVGEHPAFGGVQGSHSATGGHYDALAIDVNSAADETMAESKAVAKLLSGAGGVALGAMARRLKRIELEGPKGPLRSMGQAAIDKVHKAANAYIAKKTPQGVAGTVPGGSYKGPLNRTFPKGSNQTISFNDAAMLAEMAGLPGITYAQIAQGESGLRPGAISSDGGYGLWQMTPRVQSPSTVAAWERIGSYFNPWNNARQAKYLAGSGTGVSNYYGTGFMTDPNKHYTGPMKKFASGGRAPTIGGRSAPISGSAGASYARVARAIANDQRDIDRAVAAAAAYQKDQRGYYSPEIKRELQDLVAAAKENLAYQKEIVKESKTTNELHRREIAAQARQIRGWITAADREIGDRIDGIGATTGAGVGVAGV